MPPTLPFELVEYIITLALDSLADPHVLQSRYDLLLPLARVSLTFRTIAQPLLFKCAWLRSPEDTRLFLHAVEKRHEHLGSRVVELRLDAGDANELVGEKVALEQFGPVRLVLRKCKRVRTFVVTNLTLGVQGLRLLERESVPPSLFLRWNVVY